MSNLNALSDALVSVLGRPVVWTVRHVRSVPVQGIAQTIKNQTRAHDRALMVIRAFYAMSLMFTVMEMNRWLDLRDSSVINPQWPAAWIDASSPRGHIDLILGLFLVGSLSAALWPTYRSFRSLYFVGLLQYMAVKNGFGKVNHDFHMWLWASGLFVALPTSKMLRTPTARVRHSVLSVVWAVQVISLFFYTLTGLWKLAHAVQAIAASRPSAFDLNAFSLIVADRLMETSQRAILGDFLVRNSFPGWVLFTGTIYLESFALLAVLRPRLHRLWGGGLILFHLGTQLVMGFTFIPAFAFLGLFFLCSPFAPDRSSAREVVADLPGVLLVIRWWRRRAETASSVAVSS